MADSTLFDRIFNTVDAALNTYITTTATDMINFVTPIFTSLMIIWIAIWGYMMMFGKTSEPLTEGIYRILRIGLILTLGLTIGTYMDVVVDLFSKGPETIATIISGSKTGTAATTLDNLFTKVFNVSEAAWEKGGIMNGNFGMYFIAIIVLLVGAILTLFVAFLILLSKIMTTVLLAVGPLFFTMLLFNATQRFFESWLSMVMNFGFILILSSAIGKLITTIASEYVDSLGTNASALANLGDTGMLCIVFGLCTLVVKQVPAVAAALGGGIALATQGAIRSAMNAMRPTTMRNQYQGIKRDARLAGSAATSPFRGVKSGYAAYQRKFGGNSIAGM